MSEHLSLSRAARLAGVSRGDLQTRLRQLDIETFEGSIQVADLVRAYPDIDVDRDPVLERVALIREEAFAHRGRKDSALPEAAVLMSRLHDFQTLLTKTKAALNMAEQLVRDLDAALHDALQGHDAQLRDAVIELRRRLDKALHSHIRTNDREAALFAKDALLSLISATVKILPSGHEYFVTGQDSVLEAALKAGLHLNYGCASGNCGECRVKVLAGEVRRIRDYDYVLSATEQDQGYVLACSHTAVTDLLIEANEAHLPSDLPQQKVRAIVRKQLPLAPDLTLLQVQTPRTHTLRFMAGQRVSVSTDDGLSVELPVASCPCDARNLQFLLRAGEQDPIRARLATRDNPTLLVRGPFGAFLLQEESTAPAVFVSVGDGIAPIKSLVEHAIAIDNAVTLHLFRIDDIPPGGYIGKLCRAWNDALDNLTYYRLAADLAPAATLAELLQRFPRLAGCQVYVAAPDAWLTAFRAALATTDIAAEGLHFDAIDLDCNAQP